MKVDGKSFEEKSPKCEKYLKPLQKKVDLEDIGGERNNNLIYFLKCEQKVRKICRDQEVAYSKCHSSVMGVGSFQGRKHCAYELEALYSCLSKH